jgi:hypothetical protein
MNRRGSVKTAAHEESSICGFGAVIGAEPAVVNSPDGHQTGEAIKTSKLDQEISFGQVETLSRKERKMNRSGPVPSTKSCGKEKRKCCS